MWNPLSNLLQLWWQARLSHKTHHSYAERHPEGLLPSSLVCNGVLFNTPYLWSASLLTSHCQAAVPASGIALNKLISALLFRLAPQESVLSSCSTCGRCLTSSETSPFFSTFHSSCKLLPLQDTAHVVCSFWPWTISSISFSKSRIAANYKVCC